MSEIAQVTGIGRATLYKDFPDVDAILAAWHERQIRGQLDRLATIGNGSGSAAEQLEAVLRAYAHLSLEHHSGDLAALLHRGEHVARAQLELTEFIRQLITEGVAAGELRDDVPADELAGYCLRGVTAAGDIRSKAGVGRLVTVILAGLRTQD